jgi:myosin heavy subunit
MEGLLHMPGQSAKKGFSDVEKRIIACDAFLEAFGNSGTSLNDNSSRFGKYVKMYFGLYEDKVFGAVIKNFLLEKSRVIKMAKKERGFHIFYMML